MYKIILTKRARGSFAPSKPDSQAQNPEPTCTGGFKEWLIWKSPFIGLGQDLLNEYRDLIGLSQESEPDRLSRLLQTLCGPVLRVIISLGIIAAS